MALKPTYPRVVFKLSDGTVKYTTILTKRKVSGVLTNLRNNNVQIQGEGAVEYTRHDKNEFTFNNEDELLVKLLPCIEKELLDEFRQT